MPARLPSLTPAPVRTVLVDDCAEVRFLVAAFLEADRRFLVEGEAHDGQSALYVVRDVRPDLVITDLRMDGRDGLWLLGRMRHQWPGMCLVGLSAYVDDQTRAAGLAAGADLVVEKDAMSHRLCDELFALAAASNELAVGVLA